MARSRFKTREELEQERQEAQKYMPGAQMALPIDKLIVLYGRQSTVKQVVNNKESAQQQTIDMLNYALELGWPDNLRLLFIENQLADGTVRKASGRLRIDQRPGLQEVVRLIQTGTVGAILVRSIDRLFRDETHTQPPVFLNICKDHHVIVLTLNGDYYDFNNPRRDDDNRFINEAQKAKDYIKHHIRGVMLKNKERKALRGEYHGGTIPTGLMLDDTRTHFIANPIWLPVVVRLLKRFRELDGNYAMLRREVAGKPIFPELPLDFQERVGHIYLLKVESGYAVNSWNGLRDMLCNVALIGHVRYKGRLIENTHAPVVDEELFWFAFNHLSDTGIDGETIERDGQVKRYYQGKEIPRTALLDGTRENGKPVIISKQGIVYVNNRASQAAAYSILAKDALKTFVASIRVIDLDTIIVQRLIEQLSPDGELHDELQFYVNPPAPKPGEYTPYEPGKDTYSQLQKLLQTQPTTMIGVNESIEQAHIELDALEREYKATKHLMTEKEMVENRQTRNQLVKDIAEMKKKRDASKASVTSILAIEQLLQHGAQEWYTLPLDTQRGFLRMVTKTIELEAIEGDWLRLTIRWQPYPGMSFADMALIYRQGTGRNWDKSEMAILRRMYGNATRAEILAALPHRTWKSIMSQARRKKILRYTYANGSDLPAWLSVHDKQMLDTYGLKIAETTLLTCWWKADARTWLEANPSSEGVSWCAR